MLMFTAVFAAQIDARFRGDPQSPIGQQRPAPATAAPPYSQDKHRLFKGTGESVQSYGRLYYQDSLRVRENFDAYIFVFNFYRVKTAPQCTRTCIIEVR